MEQISHYRILKRLGAGGMGEVYLAEDMKLGRKVAIKVLSEEYTTSKDRLNRFEQEACSEPESLPGLLRIVERCGSESCSIGGGKEGIRKADVLTDLLTLARSTAIAVCDIFPTSELTNLN